MLKLPFQSVALCHSSFNSLALFLNLFVLLLEPKSHLLDPRLGLLAFLELNIVIAL
jgi:hypothetical protein